MPSALSCDPSQRLRPRPQATLFASPPASPPTTASGQGDIVGNIVNTCRSLQSLMSTPLSVPSDQLPPLSMAQLPTPPMAYAPPPLKLRLRSRAKPDAPAGKDEHLIPRKKVVKRVAAPPPRGANKRRRADDDDMGRDDFESQDEGDDDDQAYSPLAASPGYSDSHASPTTTPSTSFSSISSLPSQPSDRPSTPKRARIAPEHLPLGLERSDFHDMHLRALPPSTQEQPQDDGEPADGEAGSESWTAEDDRILVELVLDKLKLTKTEWQDCARSLGRDRHSVGKRWKSLMANGDVGVKRRRAKLHSTWR
jgi:hypothetical protein